MSFEKPVLLVTGGSRGIGAAVSLQAAKVGWHVVVNFAQNVVAANQVVSDIASAGGSAIALQGDVGSHGDILPLFAEIDRLYGRLDGLVNNAGIVDIVQRVDEMSYERLDRMFRVNTLGSVLCAREAVKRMSTRHGGKGGAIVNVSSAATQHGAPGQYVDYAASKGAIEAFTIGLGREVAEEGIRVNAVRPGIIDTEIHASGGLPDRARDLSPLIPMKRPGAASEVADAILYLLSPQSTYVTGSILNVSGGR